jgi:NAD-dependent SIR2 family protein deacetylase
LQHVPGSPTIPWMNADPEMMECAVRTIRAAEAIVITAGAGMGVDSGLPDFRGPEGFWRNYPSYAKLGLSFEQLANPEWFERDPALAWGFYGHRLDLYRRTTPHEGFARLLRWAQKKPPGCFVFTSNVDGQFQKAGFAEERVVECHGSLLHLQCVKPCCAATWPAPEEMVLTIDPATMRATGELPRCRSCGGLARPNVLMFGDESWSPGRTSAQQVRFQAWLRSLARGRFVVIELGAGTRVSTVRAQSEELAAAGRVPLIRINPRDFAGPPNAIPLPGTALAVLRELDARIAG